VASSSSISPVCQELPPASSFLKELLLSNHSSGITASPFIADCEALLHSVSLHGIVVHGLSHEGYRSILLRHVFGGDCLQGPFNNDRTACRYFAHNFNSPTEMTKTAFDIISSATSKERSTDELLSLFHTLDFIHVFKPRNLRDRILPNKGSGLCRSSALYLFSVV
jgi:hypothetical protein